VLDGFVDFKFRVIFQVFPDGGFGVVSWPPGAVGEHVGGQVVNDGVEDDAVAADTGEGGVGFEFG